MKPFSASVWLLMLALPAAPGADGVAQRATVASPTSPAATSRQAYVSGWLKEVLKLARAGVDESTILSFVESAGTFNLGADEIIHLRDLGLSSAVINAMILHDADLASGLRQTPASAVPASAPTIPATALGTLAAAGAESRPAGQLPVPVAAPEMASESRPSPGLDEWSERSEFAEPAVGVGEENIQEALWPPAAAAQATTPRITSTPVREPYAVKLIDPILVYPIEPTIPNVVTIEFIR